MWDNPEVLNSNYWMEIQIIEEVNQSKISHTFMTLKIMQLKNSAAGTLFALIIAK